MCYSIFLNKNLVVFQAWSVPEVLRPLYESSKILAQKMTIAVRTMLWIFGVDIVFFFFFFSCYSHWFSVYFFNLFIAYIRLCAIYDKLLKKPVEKYNMVAAANLLS